MNEILLKYKKPLLKLLAIVGVLFGIYATAIYLIPFFLPFVIAFLVAMINEPIIHFLEKRVKIPRKFASAISLLITLSILTVLLITGIVKIYNELVILQSNISNYLNSTSDQLTNYFNQATAYYKNLPPDITSTIESSIKGLAPKINGLITPLVTYLLNTVSSIPKMAIFVIVTLLSSYFMSSDRKEIRTFFRKQMPDSWFKNISGIKSDAFGAFFGYLKALLLLMLITFVEVTTGLLILRADYALLLGVIVAVADALPIVGTGVILVPLMLYNLITGNMHMVIGLAVIYVLGVIIRQILEPKIVGDQIGLHPLVTLFAIYIGLQVFGVIGMIIGPVSVIILKSLQTSGIIKIWND